MRDARALASTTEKAHSIVAEFNGNDKATDADDAAFHAALVLAELEHLARAGRSVPDWALAWRPTDGPPPTANTATVLDLRGLAVASLDDFADLRGADPLLFGPVLRSRAWVRGDCDIVASGLLIEIKSGETARSVVSRDVVWQLALYALGDTDDLWEIHSVGIAAVRWRTWILWPLDALLRDLSGEELPLASWREELVAASESC